MNKTKLIVGMLVTLSMFALSACSGKLPYPSGTSMGEGTLGDVTNNTAPNNNPGNPYPLTSSVISGDVSGTGKVEQYYVFNAGPGKVTMTVDMQTKSGTMIDYDFYIYDTKWNKLTGFFDVLGNSVTKRTVKEINQKKERKLFLKIVAKPSWGSGSFRVRLEGAVKLSKN